MFHHFQKHMYLWDYAVWKVVFKDIATILQVTHMYSVI